MLNIITIYGFILLFGVILFLERKQKRIEISSENTVVSSDKYFNPIFIIIIFLIFNAVAYFVCREFLIADNIFTREFGFFLNVLDNLKNNIYPNVNFYYPYGIFPLALYRIFDLVIRNPILALVGSKVLLDIIAVFLIVGLLKTLKNDRIISVLLLVVTSGIQILFFSPGALHNSPIRYLILLMPLILLLKFFDNKKIVYLILFLLSPIISYLVAPETGLIAFVYIIMALLAVSFDQEILGGLKEKKKYLLILSAAFITLILIFHNNLFFFVKNSYEYASAIASGLIAYNLPPVYPIIISLIKNKSYDGVVQLSWNIMFYAYLIPLSVLVSYSLNFLVKIFKEKRVAVLEFSVLSLTFFALSYLLKTLGGFVGISYESLTLFFVIIAFVIISKKYSGWDLKISKYILIAYVAILFIPWSYFLYKYQIAKRGDYHPFYDSRSDTYLSFTDNYLVSIKSLISLSENIKSSKKIFLFTDEAPGMYYLIGRPNYTRYLNPGFVFSENTRKELLDDLKKNNFDYIFITKRESNYLSSENSKKTLESIDDYLKKNYQENDNDLYYKVLIRK